MAACKCPSVNPPSSVCWHAVDGFRVSLHLRPLPPSHTHTQPSGTSHLQVNPAPLVCDGVVASQPMVLAMRIGRVCAALRIMRRGRQPPAVTTVALSNVTDPQASMAGGQTIGEG